MPNPLALTLQALAAQTAGGQSATFDLLDPAFAEDGLSRRLAELMLEVTAASGTAPTLNVVVETSPNTSGFEEVGAFQEFEGVGFQRLKFATLERYVRVKWTVGGTGSPSFTFKVAGFAHVIYADTEDFYQFGLPRAAVGDEPTDPVDLLAASLLASSSIAVAQIKRAHALPIKEPYPESRRPKVSELAGYKFLAQRGFDPDRTSDKEVKARHDAAEKWFASLGGGVEPDWVDATPEVYDAGAGVASAPRRGW